MEQPPQNCPDCGAPIRFIPAGISKKTGKKYNSFYSCENRCGYVYREQELKPAQEIIKETKVIPVFKIEKEDLEKILNPLRLIYKQNEEIKKILQNLKIIDIYYPNNKIERKYEINGTTKNRKKID